MRRFDAFRDSSFCSDEDTGSRGMKGIYARTIVEWESTVISKIFLFEGEEDWKEGRLGKSVEGEARPEEVSETSLMRF